MTDKKDECCGEEGCACGEEGDSIEEVAIFADDKVDALINLLIKKKIISEKEFKEEYDSLYNDDEQ